MTSLVLVLALVNWNANAKQFIFAPAFNFPAAAGAHTYHFTIHTSEGKQLQMWADEPTASLWPIWSLVPQGTTTVSIEALDAKMKRIAGPTTRSFHRGQPFKNAKVPAAVMPYDQSARVALDTVLREPFVQHWRTTGQPDPAYPLYRYSSKIISSILTACALDGSPEAHEIARRAADYLLSITCKADTPLAGFPPTYHNAKPTERENDNWTLLFSPAEAGHGYLDLYNATHDEKYLTAATTIADGYARLQLPTGTWPLKVDNRTGKPISDLVLIPSTVIRFLDRLITQHHQPKYQSTLDRAVAWTMANPVRTFDWQAQFDDAKLRGPYQNLAKHEACEFAVYLLDHANGDELKVVLAQDIIHFAEDQFVIWGQPPALKPRSPQLDPANWFIPCSTEQYAMFEPISGSSAFMMVAFLRAHQITHNPEYLAKAKGLANALTIAQQHHHGRYPTRMIREDLAYWVNSTVNTIKAMQLLAAETKATTQKSP